MDYEEPKCDIYKTAAKDYWLRIDDKLLPLNPNDILELHDKLTTFVNENYETLTKESEEERQSVYDLAEAHLQAEAEQYMKYLQDEQFVKQYGKAQN